MPAVEGLAVVSTHRIHFPQLRPYAVDYLKRLRSLFRCLHHLDQVGMDLTQLVVRVKEKVAHPILQFTQSECTGTTCVPPPATTVPTPAVRVSVASVTNLLLKGCVLALGRLATVTTSASAVFVACWSIIVWRSKLDSMLTASHPWLGNVVS